VSAGGAAAKAGYPVAPEGLPPGARREGAYEIRFATTLGELDEILKLRFEIFNLELGEGLEESFATGRDEDEFDAVCHHLMVREHVTGELVGSYRLQTSDMAASRRGFYSDAEFDLSALPAAVRAGAVELGRACVAREHRNKRVLFLLWKGLAQYVATNRLRYLFGCSSLTSSDPAEGRALMARLESEGHVHPGIRLEPRDEFRCYEPGYEAPAGVEPKLPTLFRIYLRHGAKICGPPALDWRFRTIDYFTLFDVEAMDPKMFRTFFE